MMSATGSTILWPLNTQFIWITRKLYHTDTKLEVERGGAIARRVEFIAGGEQGANIVDYLYSGRHWNAFVSLVNSGNMK